MYAFPQGETPLLFRDDFPGQDEVQGNNNDGRFMHVVLGSISAIDKNAVHIAGRAVSDYGKQPSNCQRPRAGGIDPLGAVASGNPTNADAGLEHLLRMRPGAGSAHGSGRGSAWCELAMWSTIVWADACWRRAYGPPPACRDGRSRWCLS